MVAALLAGAVAFSACKKDDDTDPAAEGKKAAQGICDCWKQTSYAKFEDCADKVWEATDKWDDESEAWWDKFESGYMSYSCNATKPSWWDEDEDGEWEWYLVIKTTLSRIRQLFQSPAQAGL